MVSAIWLTIAYRKRVRMQEAFLAVIEDDSNRDVEIIEETLKDSFSAGAPWFDEA